MSLTTAQRILCGVIIGLILYAITLLWQGGVDRELMRQDQKHTLEKLESHLRTAHTRAQEYCLPDATRDFAVRDAAILRVAHTLDAIDKRLAVHLETCNAAVILTRFTAHEERIKTLEDKDR